MRLITLNTWNTEGPWEDRWELIFAECQRLEPDVIAFQEIFDADWVEKIAMHLESPYWAFSSDASGLALFSKHPILEWSERAYQTQSPLEDYRRYFLWVRLLIEKRVTSVVNTHLSWKEKDSATRFSQIQELLKALGKTGPQEEILSVGDFNAIEKTKEMELMRTQFLDGYRTLHPQLPGLTWDNRNTFTATHGMPDRRLDYVFVKKETFLAAKLKDVDLIFTEPQEGVYPSDHFGLFARFESDQEAR